VRDGTAHEGDFGESHRTPADVQADDSEPEATEKITLIEFTWTGLRGAQPVIFVAREWLQ
jgi:hypothetical protein